MKNLLLYIAICITWISSAQIYPVQVTPQLVPPYSLKLSDYQTTSSEKLFVNLLLTDTQELGRQVRLKMYIEGQGLNIQTLDFVAGATPISLDGGINQRLSNLDLRPYFNLNNLLGLTPQQYNQPLPDGRYNFCFEVYDFLSGQRLSRKSCFPVYLILNDPPFLNVPNRSDLVTAQNPQNIIFNWTPRHLNATGVQYEFTLKELWDTGLDPQAAFLASPPLHQETTFATTLLYGPANIQLLEGKIYGWQVRALVSDGISETSVFRNNGYSEIYHFRYEGNCDAPGFILSEAQNSQTVQITWDFSNHLRYEIQYRKKGYGDDDWFSLYAYNQQSNIHNLEAGVTYEFRVGGECTPKGGFAFSAIHEFTTPTEEETAYYNCGIPPEIEITNQNPLPNITVNETFTAGDFPVVIREVTGNNGNFSGWGYITFPFLEQFKEVIDAVNTISEGDINIGKYTRIRVVFNGIGINTDYQLINGFVETEYDPDWKGIISIDDAIDDVFGSSGEIDTFDATNIDIASVEVDENGNIVLIDEAGNPHPIEADAPVVITGANNEQWTVNEDGTVTQGQAAQGGVPTKNNTNGIANNGDVTQISSTDVSVLFTPSGFYGTDQLRQDITDNRFTNKYESIPQTNGGDYNVLYKAISNAPQQTDILTATATLSNEKTTDDIVFKTKQGTAITPTWSGNTATLTLQKQFDFAKDEILATVKPVDSTANYDIAGKVNIWHLQQQQVNVTIVPIGNGTVSSNLASELNAIYNPVGVHFNIAVDSPMSIAQNIWDIDNPNGKLDIGDSNTLANYTIEERAIYNHYKNQRTIQEQMYYIFVLGDDITITDNSTQGFMPLKRQYGFVFNPTNKSRTIAHELGHGIFGLEHPFTEYAIPERTTDLLMDYGTGTAFTHMDWQKTHASGLQLYLFQGDEDGESSSISFVEINSLGFIGDDVYDGIEPSGKIIEKIEINDSNKFIIQGVSSHYQFVVYAITVYEYTNPEKTTWQKVDTYRARFNDNGFFTKYFNTSNDIFPGSILYKDSGNTNITYNLENNGCNYLYNSIYWDSNITSVNDLISQLNVKWQSSSSKKTGAFFSPDPSCFIINSLSSLIEKDNNSNICSSEKTASDAQELNTLFDKTSYTDDEVVSLIVEQGVCLSALRQMSWEKLRKAFNQLGSSNEIKEDKEITLLRLMAAINSTNYSDFIALLESENNENTLLLNLIDKAHDKSINPFDGDNFTSFISGLMAIYNLQPEIWQNRIKPIENEDLLGQVVSISDFNFGTPENSILSRYTGLAKYKGSLNNEKEIEIIRQLYYSTTSPSTQFTTNIWITDPDFTSIKLNPLDPIIILTKNNLPLVTTAINGIEPIGENIYVVPAIFLEYKTQKEFNEAVETGVILTLDIVTIAASGGTALATKVHWARRLWALAEVVGAAGNIAVNVSDAVDPNSDFGKTINYYNTVMGIIGLKNGTIGLKNVVKNLPQATKDLIKNKSNIRELLLAKYIDYRIAITRLRNSDEWTQLPQEVRQGLISEKNIYDELVDIDNATTYHWGTESSNFINGKTADDILNIPKPNRPNPNTYLSNSYIDNHLNNFRIKASYLVTGDTYSRYILTSSSVGRANGLFISTKNDIDVLLSNANGNISIIEQDLGIPMGNWQGKEGIYRIDIIEPENYNLRIPWGNETGANDLWLPGGRLPNGKREAVTDPIPTSNIIATKVIN